MPFTETITIINNSGKIISTGKHLVNIFKDAKAAYREKRQALKSERAAIRRTQTFDVRSPCQPMRPYYAYDGTYETYNHDHDPDRDQDGDHVVYERKLYLNDEANGRQEDTRSRASSSQTYRSRHSHRHRRRSSSHGRPALTESNLRTLSEVSSTPPSAPSGASRTYRSPYAETMPRDVTLSRPTLACAPAPSTVYLAAPGPAIPAPAVTETGTPRQSILVHRPRSDPALRNNKTKQVDMDLAYGSMPPDLANRVDLDPDYGKDLPQPQVQQEQEAQARTLMERVEGFLEEAECLHYSASAAISHLQGNPEAAAAVALTLAELSSLLGKMSPAFLAIVKGGSPAVFALLASPQFLIGAGVAVGVTVVMFGGWKIVKRIRDAKQREREEAVAFEAQNTMPASLQSRSEPQPSPSPVPAVGGTVYKDRPLTGQLGIRGFARGAANGSGTGSVDEALVLEEELSTIESWRRGILPFGEDGTADIELMSPEAERAIRGYFRRDDDGIDPADSVSRSGRSERTSRSHRMSKSRHGPSSSYGSRRHSDGESDRDRADITTPEQKSNRGLQGRHDRDGRDHDDEERSERSRRSHRSHHSSLSKGPERGTVKAIEDGSRETENTLEAVLRPKEKKGNMLKTLFKKKDREYKERHRTEMSVLV